MSQKVKVETHHLYHGRFIRAGLYEVGEVPEEIGVLVEPEDEPEHSEVVEEAPAALAPRKKILRWSPERSNPNTKKKSG